MKNPNYHLEVALNDSKFKVFMYRYVNATWYNSDIKILREFAKFWNHTRTYGTNERMLTEVKEWKIK